MNWSGASTNRVRILLASSIAVRKSTTLKPKLIVTLSTVPLLLSSSQRKDKLDYEGQSSHPDGRHHMRSPQPRGLSLAARRLICVGQVSCKAPISISHLNYKNMTGRHQSYTWIRKERIQNLHSNLAEVTLGTELCIAQHAPKNCNIAGSA